MDLHETTVARTETAKGRVLVVEDEQALRRANARILERDGFSVVEACDGREAVSALAEGEFDVILSDITMPGMTGMQLLRHVRETDPDVPVVLITANPAMESAVQAVELGALKYLIKPVGARELVDMIEQATRSGRVAKFKRKLVASAGRTTTLMVDRETMERALDRALKSLWIAYQPIVNFRKHKVVAYEALLRSGERELPNPEILLSVAGRLNRLREVGRAIRHTVARDISQHAPKCPTFVNLHPADLLDDELYSPGSQLAQYAGNVVLEITEREALDDKGDVSAHAQALRKLGYRIAVDDVGAGYSGLNSFAKLKPEVAKIDMQLVRGIHTDAVKQKLVSSLVGVCGELGASVVAEGVETASERDCLARLGCDYFQGYLFAKPARPYPEVTW